MQQILFVTFPFFALVFCGYVVALAVDMIVTSSLCIALSRLDGANEHGVSRAVGKSLRGMLANPLPWSIGLG
jgi:malonate transporter and related proteins